MMGAAVAASLIVFAIARPQTGRSENTIKTEGIDIVLLLDTSSSMQAEDLKPKNRLYVAKQVVKEFISKRKNDRIGLVVFSAQSITQCPLTLDYAYGKPFLDHYRPELLRENLYTADGQNADAARTSPPVEVEVGLVVQS